MSGKVARGVFRDPIGLRAFVRTKDGRLRSKRFPAESLAAAKRWREETKARGVLKIHTPTRAESGTLAADAVRYLEAVRGMASYTDRKRDIEQWIDQLGTRPRSTIEAVDVRRCLETWRADRKLAASTLNHRRTALMHLFRVLDGKSAPNPVADVPKYTEGQHAALIYSPADITRVLDGMQDSKAKRILSVLAWTGWPYKQISQLTPADLSKLDEGMARVTPRRKGAGAVGRWVPLLPPAITALKALQIPDDLTVSTKAAPDVKTRGVHRRNLHNAWTAACKRAKLTPCRPYDLRHAFGTLIATETADARAVYELMLHADPKQALRYTKAAGMSRAQEAIRAVTFSVTGIGRNWASNAPTDSRRKPRKKAKSPRK